MKRYLLPLAVFLVVLGFLAVGLQLKPREVPSPFIGKAAPAFTLPLLDAPEKSISVPDMRGKVWVLNVWASWCGPCQVEHPHITELARSSGVPVLGLNYKDKTEDAKAWLQRLGNPYAATLVDVKGLTGIEWGVYGVPETFVIDKGGVIRHKHVGPVSADDVRETLLPLLKKLGA